MNWMMMAGLWAFAFFYGGYAVGALARDRQMAAFSAGAAAVLGALGCLPLLR